ncbi:MAG: DNA mismatch endonuclease, patch repair protein [bacterium F082]|nr:MAG: DNA mismatch endonuclease, patch repair protein [bacterium F082]KWW29606.1 MAG: DNA mismatch endonuclease, patch repair protein [bacterium P201]
MTDKMTPTQRHYCMSRIHGKGTKPELKVRQWLWRHGYRYRLNVKSVPGKPDIVMRRYRTAIFVNGCFWHGHFVHFGVESLGLRVESQLEVESGVLKVDSSQCCKIPQTNREFWVNKIKRNQERDQQNYQVLHDNGWQVIVVWECQLTPKRIEETMLRVELMLNEHFLALHQPKVVPYDVQETPAAMAAESLTSS